MTKLYYIVKLVASFIVILLELCVMREIVLSTLICLQLRLHASLEIATHTAESVVVKG